MNQTHLTALTQWCTFSDLLGKVTVSNYFNAIANMCPKCGLPMPKAFTHCQKCGSAMIAVNAEVGV